MISKEHKSIILEFLSLPKDQQLAYLADTKIADIVIRRFKTTKNRRDQTNASRRKIALNLIHSDFNSLINCFEINLETGIVEVAGAPTRKPGRTKQGYLLYMFKGRAYLCHRLVMMKAVGGFLPIGKEVDHINSITDDNRITNLRLVDPRKNKDYWQKVKSGDFDRMDA